MVALATDKNFLVSVTYFFKILYIGFRSHLG